MTKEEWKQKITETVRKSGASPATAKLARDAFVGGILTLEEIEEAVKASKKRPS